MVYAGRFISGILVFHYLLRGMRQSCATNSATYAGYSKDNLHKSLNNKPHLQVCTSVLKQLRAILRRGIILSGLHVFILRILLLKSEAFLFKCSWRFCSERNVPFLTVQFCRFYQFSCCRFTCSSIFLFIQGFMVFQWSPYPRVSIPFSVFH